MAGLPLAGCTFGWLHQADFAALSKAGWELS
jgi:hypothetical protein